MMRIRAARIVRHPGFSMGRRQISPESGWIATISKPRFSASIKLERMGRRDLEPAMTGHTFCNLRHRDRPLRHRLGSARHQCGAAADGERGQDPRPHPPALWRYRGGAAAGRGAARDRRHRRTARGQAERSLRRRARSRRRSGIPPRRLRHRPHHPAGQDA